jgi:hypothetical protein
MDAPSRPEAAWYFLVGLVALCSGAAAAEMPGMQTSKPSGRVGAV